MDSQPGTGNHLADAADLSMPCRLLFDGSPLPTIAVAGARHIVCYVNPAFCGLSAKSDDKLIGDPFAEIVMEEGILSILDRVHRTGKAEIVPRPKGKESWFIRGLKRTGQLSAIEAKRLRSSSIYC